MGHRASEERAESRRRSWVRTSQIALGLAILVGLAYALVRAHSISSEATTVLHHFNPDRLPWLAVAVAAEALSFVCYAMVQRSLLIEGGARLPARSMLSLAIAATGLTNLLPGGTAPSSGWLVSQYRKRGIPMPLALWAVLAGGFAATVAVLFLTLVGASVAGLLPPLGMVACAVALAGGSIGFIAAARHVDSLDRWFRNRRRAKRVGDLFTRISKHLGDASKFRTTPAAGARVMILSVGNWGLDVACLVAAFALLGEPVPWRTVLFAYSLAQIAGSLAPVPGGIGFVEGGMVGAFALAGTPLGGAILATVLYRLITTIGVAGVGTLMLVYLGRQKSTPRAELSGEATALEQADSDPAR
jgi:uncharacterized protein (TIRG00374 family)